MNREHTQLSIVQAFLLQEQELEVCLALKSNDSLPLVASRPCAEARMNFIKDKTRGWGRDKTRDGVA